MEIIHFDDTNDIEGIEIENADAILEKLILDNHKTLLGFASCVLSNPDNAEDAVQETYLVAQIKRSEMLNSLKPAGWLMKTLKNIIGDIYRRRNKMMELFVPLDENLATNGFPVNPRLEYEGIIGKKDLDLLFLIYCDEMPYKEAADKLGISLSACKKQIQRAKFKFQQAMEEDKN